MKELDTTSPPPTPFGIGDGWSVRAEGIGYVCPGFEGSRSRGWRRWFEDAVEKAGIHNFRWHDLRHTFASRLVMAGVPFRAVQMLLGHERIETTLRYSHLGDTHLGEAVERLTACPSDPKSDTAQNRPSAEAVAVSA